MKQLGTLALGIGIGFVIAALMGIAPAGAARGGGAGAPLGNGDVNADGRIDLSDPIFLLNWLFLAGREPEPIDCNPPPPSLARFRFTSEIPCNDGFASADLNLCSYGVTSENGEASSCDTLEVFPDCQLRVFSSSQCAEIGICAQFTPRADRLYDFVLREQDGEPSVVWYEQALAPDAECPPPAIAGAPDGSVSVSCGEPPPSRFRLVNRHTCVGSPTTAKLDFCTQSLLDTSGDDAGDCIGIFPALLCLATVRLSAPCADATLCADLGVDAGQVYDFVVSGEGSAVSGSWFKQPLNPDGSCPPPPAGDAKPAGALAVGCDGRD